MVVLFAMYTSAKLAVGLSSGDKAFISSTNWLSDILDNSTRCLSLLFASFSLNSDTFICLAFQKFGFDLSVLLQVNDAVKPFVPLDMTKVKKWRKTRNFHKPAWDQYGVYFREPVFLDNRARLFND